MSTLGRALQQTAARYAGKTAMLDTDGSFTWAEFGNRIARLASALTALGLNPGDRFGILAANSRRQAELICAGYWSGITPVPVNTRLAAVEIAAILEDAGCTLLASDASGDELLADPALAKWQNRRIGLLPEEHDERIANATAMTLTERRPDDEALLLYTGGTTGRAKGVALSHRNILSNALQIDFAWPGTADDIVLHVAPMFHSAELVMTHLFLRGAAHAYLPRFTPAEFLAAIEKYQITITMMVPSMVIMTTDSNGSQQYDISSLKRLLYGASPMSRDSMQKAMRFFPDVEFIQGYGLTETAPLISMLDHESHLEAIANPESGLVKSCGQPLPAIDIRIVGDDGNEVATGAMGEIVVRGPNVFAKYLNGSGDADGSPVDGWFQTGDIGKIDANGFLYVLDRKKDIIKVGGESVCSGDVEAVLNTHPDILETAVIGLPSHKFGEKVFAVVVARSDSKLSRRDIRDHCRGKIGNFKIPSGVAFVDALPRSALGKVLKSQLRDQYAADSSR